MRCDVLPPVGASLVSCLTANKLIWALSVAGLLPLHQSAIGVRVSSCDSRQCALLVSKTPAAGGLLAQLAPAVAVTRQLHVWAVRFASRQNQSSYNGDERMLAGPQAGSV